MGFIDLHCDTIEAIYQAKLRNEVKSLKESNLHIDLKKLRKAKYFAQCFAMFVNIKKVNNPFDTCIDMIDCFYEEVRLNPDLKVCVSYNDILKCQREKKISAILTIEDAGVLESKISNLRILYRLGVRMICLNWNYENGVGYPNYGKYILNKPDYITPNMTNGLTDFGKILVKEMNHLGIIIDVSHLSDKGFWDVLALSKKPIVASHSNSRTICKHVRNLTDEMIIALYQKGGVMGLNYYPDFLDDDKLKGKNTVDCLIKHINHIKTIVGVEVISLGSDFDGFNDEIELKDASLLPSLIDRLEKEGYTKEEIEQITYKNALRVFFKNL